MHAPEPDDWIGAAVRASASLDPVELEQARAAVLGAVGDAPSGREPRVGRYLLLDRLGKGTSGVVYRAYDPELHRAVAVKLLRANNLGIDGLTDQLLREARAIARLSHPNIVAVHDVGALPAVAGGHAVARGHGLASGHGPRVFVVMELVEGTSVERWLGAEARPWREVVDVFVPIGRALAAAHRGGIIHRDVKPANMLLGADGRPRLADFGLVGVIAAADGIAPRLEPADPFEGLAVGTPNTMAPEQHLGAVADARTDQYGYCASLFLALHGRAPFMAQGLAALLEAKRRGTPTPIRRVPAWLSAVIARGLAADPARRFADMNELLARIEHGRTRARRWFGAGIVAASCAATLALVARPTEPGAGERCRERGAAEIARVWTPTVRTALRDGIVATGAPSAARVAENVDAELAARVDDVAATHEAVCERLDYATVPEAETATQLGCLDGLLADVEELSALLAAADDEVVHGAIDAARHLVDAERCVDVTATPGSTAPELELTLRRARLHESAGRIASAAELAELALAQALERGDVRAEARARMVLCDVEVSRGGRGEAEPACEAAWLSAERADLPTLGLSAMIELVRLVPEPSAALRMHRLAEARLASLPHPPPGARVRLGAALVSVREEAGHLEEARTIATETLASAVESFGATSIELVPALNTAANLEFRVGHLAVASELYGRAVAITEAVRGADDRDMGTLLNNRGGVQLEQGAFAPAAATLERALAIKIATLGPSSPRLIHTLHRLARTRAATGEHGEAEALAQRAVELAAMHRDRDAPVLARSELVLAVILEAAGDCDGAIAALDRSARIGDVALGDDDLGEALTVRGRCELAAADPRAGATLEAAAAALDRFYGPQSRDLVRPLAALARSQVAGGHADLARRTLDRARAICGRTEGNPADCEALAALE